MQGIDCRMLHWITVRLRMMIQRIRVQMSIAVPVMI